MYYDLFCILEYILQVMVHNKSLANTSFSILSKSSEFLNLVIQNINSCVLLLNNKMELQAYNDALKTIFSNKPEEDILYHRCGEVIGCAYNVEEAKKCGETSHCKTCDIRISAMKSYLQDEVIYKEHFSRPFYTQKGVKEMKHLQFSSRLFTYNREKYIILMIEDITRLVNLEEKFQ